MSAELTFEDIAAWHNREAKKHEEFAKQHRAAEKLALGNGNTITRYKRVGIVAEPQGGKPDNNLTLQSFEAAVEKHGGRVAHLAARLHTTEEVIEGFLKDPSCKLEVGLRGFIYPRKGLS